MPGMHAYRTVIRGMKLIASHQPIPLQGIGTRGARSTVNQKPSRHPVIVMTIDIYALPKCLEPYMWMCEQLEIRPQEVPL